MLMSTNVERRLHLRWTISVINGVTEGVGDSTIKNIFTKVDIEAFNP